MTRTHKPIAFLDICERCGVTAMEIMDGASPECTAPDNVVSMRALQTKKAADEMILPILAYIGL